jgi:hypothetical protein
MSWSYVYIFLQSSCLEVLIYYFCYSRTHSLKKVFLLTTFANAITHPIVFFGFMQSSLSYLIAILGAEIFAIVGETALHSYAGKIPWRKTLPAAALANTFSWQVAPILTYFILLK